MPALIVPNVCRFTVNGTYGGGNVATILDMRLNDFAPPLDPVDREAAIQDQAEDIVNAWSDNILPILVNEYTAVSVSWVDLNSADGSTGEVTTGGDETWPQNGATTTDQGMPANVAALVTKVAPGGGRQTRNGRLYLVGISEGATQGESNSNLASAAQAAITAAFEQFSSDISNTVLSEGYSSNLVVVHTTNQGTPQNPDIVWNGTNDVTAMVCQGRLATQRRRLRR